MNRTGERSVDEHGGADPLEDLGCGACVAACPNASATLFTAATVRFTS